MCYCRFYTRFHSKAMNDLTAMGLRNFTQLFLTLSFVGDLEEVVSHFENLIVCQERVAFNFKGAIISLCYFKCDFDQLCNVKSGFTI